MDMSRGTGAGQHPVAKLLHSNIFGILAVVLKRGESVFFQSAVKFR